MTKSIYNLDPQSSNFLRTASVEVGNVFTTADAFKYLDLSKQGVYDRLSDLQKGGWIVRLKPGVYFICSFETGKEGGVTEHEFVIASYLVSPYTIGLWSALNYHGLTEQIPDRVYILSSRRVFKPVKKINSSEYQIVYVSKQRFFGIEEIWFGSKKANITDVEKTLLDGFLLPEYCGGIVEVIKGFKNALSDIDFEKLTQYGLKIGKGVVFKRMGVLLDHWNIENDQKSIWVKQISQGISCLDPQGLKEGAIISKWNIKMNFDLEGI